MNLVIIGPKGSGKSTIGKELSINLNLNFIDTDNLIESFYYTQTGMKKNFREIYRDVKETKFREIEENAIKATEENDYTVISVGGSTYINPKNRTVLRNNSITIFLETDPEILWERVSKDGIPAYLENENNPKEVFSNRIKFNKEVTIPFADIISNTTDRSINEIITDIVNQLEIEFTIRMNSPNTLGSIVRITTFGESHGKALGVVLDGLKPNIPFNEEVVQKELDRRKPGQSKVTTQRSEDDKVKILSGVFDGKTTGAPIAMIVENKDQDSSKYDNLKEIFRPGHADFTFFKKYGIKDHRGGGRTSGRETIGRVASGSIAKEILKESGIKIVAYTLKIGNITANKINYDDIENNSVRCCDNDAALKMEELILNSKNQMDSIGGIVGLEIKGLKAGIGDPVFGKLNSRLGGALLSIGSVKGIEFGLGFEFSELKGSQSNDPMMDGNFVSNNAGGLLGGISTGEDIVIRLAIKPTPSISQKQNTITKDGNNTTVEIKGRHDPCILPRIIPVVESMASLVILDAIEIQKRIRDMN